MSIGEKADDCRECALLLREYQRASREQQRDMAFACVYCVNRHEREAIVEFGGGE
jgi:hypothetical protein